MGAIWRSRLERRFRASPGCGASRRRPWTGWRARLSCIVCRPDSLLFNQAEIPAFAQFLLAGSVELLGVRGQVETLVELVQPVDLIIPAAVIGGQPYLMRARVYEEAHLLLVRRRPSAKLWSRRSRPLSARCWAVCGAVSPPGSPAKEPEAALCGGAGRLLPRLAAGTIRREISVRLPIEKHLIASQLGMTRRPSPAPSPRMARFGARPGRRHPS